MRLFKKGRNEAGSQADNEAGTEEQSMPDKVDTKPAPAEERRKALEDRLRELEADRQRRFAEIESARTQAQNEHTHAVEEARQVYNDAYNAEQIRLQEEFGTAQEKQQALAKFSEPKSAELAEQVRELDAKRDRDLQALRAKLKELPDYQRQVVELEAAEKQTLEQLSAQLLKDFHAAVDPLAEQYVATLSRDLPEKIARTYHGLNLRSKKELGEPLQRDLALTPFIDAILKTHPNALAAISQRQLYGASVSGSFDKGPRWIMRVLFDLVYELETAAEQPGTEPSPSMLALHEIRRDSVTDTERARREETLHASEREQAQRAFEASYVPPPRPSSAPHAYSPPFAPLDRPPEL